MAALLLAAGSGALSIAGAADFFVNNASGTCSPTGPGTQAQPYCTITAALTAHHDPGTRILVAPGRYREQVTLPASGASGSPITIEAQAGSAPVVVDGTDDFSNPALWTQSSGDVWLASSVTWSPRQVFADDARLTPSTASPASLPPRSFTFVAGQGLYVNAGGGNPASHAAQVGHRLYGFFVSGKAWVTITGFDVTRCEDRCIQLTNSSNLDVTRNRLTSAGKFGLQASADSVVHIASNVSSDHQGHGFSLVNFSVEITLEDNEGFGNVDPVARTANGVFMFSASRNVLRRNRWHDNQDSGEQMNGGSNDNVSIENVSWNNGDHGFDQLNSSGNLHVGDVAFGNFRNGIQVDANSPGTRIFDSIATDNGLTTSSFDLRVDTTSTSGFQGNDNLFWNSTPQPPVRFASSVYAQVSDYSAAKGQDSRTLQADPRFVSPGQGDFHLQAGSPAIDNANSGVPSWPTTDAEGHARTDDPGTPNRGLGPVTFADRGALEFQGTSSTNQPPVARITATPASGTAPLNVTLDASASSDPDGTIASYKFAFGDGATAGPQTSPTATHTYAAGHWTATVTVTDNAGATATASATVDAAAPGNQPPVARVTATPASGTAPLNVTLDASASSDPDGTIASYKFAFGDGATAGPQSTPTAAHTYAAGHWTATVTVTDNAGATATASATVDAAAPGNQPPVARVTATPSSGTAPLNVTLDASASSDPDGTIASYKFAFGDGNTAGPQSSPTATHTYAAGHWTATVTVTDNAGATASASATVDAAAPGNQPPVARITATPASGTAPLNVTLNASASSDPDGTIASYKFAFGDGNTAGPQTSPTATHTYAAGHWTATVTVTDNAGATATASATVDAASPPPPNQAPVARLTMRPSSGTAPLAVTADASASTDADGTIASYKFAFGDGTTAGPQSTPTATHTYAAGHWTATVTVTDNAGATASASATVDAASPPPPNQAPVARLTMRPSSGTAPLAVTADASASTDADGTITSYKFAFGDGTTAGPQSTPTATHTYAAGHWTATVTVTDNAGATASASATVDAASPPPSNFAGNPSFETSTSGWAAVGGASLQRVSGGFDGSFALLVTSPLLSLASFGVTDEPNWVGVTAGVGSSYHFRVWVRAETGAGVVSLRVRESSGAWVSSTTVSLSLSWTALDVDITTALTGSTLDMQVLGTPSVLGTAFRMDAVSITLASAAAMAGVSSQQQTDANTPPGVSPNPVPASGASFTLSTQRPGELRISIFDLAGREVRRLTDEGSATAGQHWVRFDGRGFDGVRLGNGVYYYQIRSPDGLQRGRLVILD